MKKTLKFLALFTMVFAILGLASCGKYKEEAGVYECISIKANGQEMISNYEYYTIELKANGDCIIRSSANNQEYEAKATFTIEDEKIKVVTKAGSQSVTEVYDYVDGKIHMVTELQGVSINAVFERQQNTTESK